VPDLPRATPEPPEFEHPLPEREQEKPPRNLFDTVWPTGTKPPAERSPEPNRNSSPARNSDRRDESSAALPSENRPVEILKSGVIDGMAYTLYTDGSIEAQLPQGTLRFGSIDDLRAHLERQH
jgi:hypothetical protein